MKYGNKKIIYSALIAGIMTGLFMVFIGFQHNPQGEYIDLATNEINLKYGLLTFLLWFACITIPLLIIGYLGSFIFTLFKQS